jgi:hypothetical protein
MEDHHAGGSRQAHEWVTSTAMRVAKARCIQTSHIAARRLMMGKVTELLLVGL